MTWGQNVMKAQDPKDKLLVNSNCGKNKVYRFTQMYNPNKLSIEVLENLSTAD